MSRLGDILLFLVAVAACIPVAWVGWLLFSVIFLGAGGPPR